MLPLQRRVRKEIAHGGQQAETRRQNVTKCPELCYTDHSQCNAKQKCVSSSYRAGRDRTCPRSVHLSVPRAFPPLIQRGSSGSQQRGANKSMQKRDEVECRPDAV